MRKLFYAAALLLISQMGFGQAVNDQAIIPVSITLNSILRLTVVSGGNIDFVVNTIDQYTAGINNGGGDARYHTNFTVSASQDFDVTIRAEDANFLGQDDATHTMPLDNVGLDLTESGSGIDLTNWDIANTAVLALTNAAQNIVTAVAGAAAGGADQNNFTIQWRLGTSEDAMNATSLLAQSLTPDRYITNVFLELVPK